MIISNNNLLEIVDKKTPFLKASSQGIWLDHKPRLDWREPVQKTKMRLMGIVVVMVKSVSLKQLVNYPPLKQPFDDVIQRAGGWIMTLIEAEKKPLKSLTKQLVMA